MVAESGHQLSTITQFYPFLGFLVLKSVINYQLVVFISGISVVGATSSGRRDV